MSGWPFPLWIPFTAGPVLGLVVAVWLGRKARWAEKAEPRRFPRGVVRRLVADEWTLRMRRLGELESLARDDPASRQEYIDEVGTQLAHAWSFDPRWRTRLWRLLAAHLRPGPEFWPDMDLSWERVLLAGVDLRGCHVRNASFFRARFGDDARFQGAVFTGDVTFEGARFIRHARFDSARFEQVNLDGLVVSGSAFFRGTTAESASLAGVRFSAQADFSGASFGAFTAFNVGFPGPTSFRDAHFGARPCFELARFGGHVDFTGASFVDGAGLEHAWARTDSYTVREWPFGWLPIGEGRLPGRPGLWGELMLR